mmetsp:Transcript_6948/g.15008  ORF Transcript_6948/g.15008 Transcript_6948/m.15008 type:complete len:147 (-) Transcript_6948:73-513(-)
MGWRKLRIGEQTASVFQNYNRNISLCTQQHGVSLAQVCIFSLAGSSSQMLWPQHADCLHSLLSEILDDNDLPDREMTCRAMVRHVLADPALKKDLSSDVVEVLMKTTFELLQEGSSKKQKFKMLWTDFAKLCHGEMKTEDLLDYLI